MALGLKRFLPTGFPDVVEGGVVYKEGGAIVLVQEGHLVQRTGKDSVIIDQKKFIKEVVINNKRSVFLHILNRYFHFSDYNVSAE